MRCEGLGCSTDIALPLAAALFHSDQPDCCGDAVVSEKIFYSTTIAAHHNCLQWYDIYTNDTSVYLLTFVYRMKTCLSLQLTLLVYFGILKIVLCHLANPLVPWSNV